MQSEGKQKNKDPRRHPGIKKTERWRKRKEMHARIKKEKRTKGQRK